MENIQSIEEFYKDKCACCLPDEITSKIGNFKLFRLYPEKQCKTAPLPYRRRDFYKVSLVVGNVTIGYADKSFEVKKQALAFSNPLIPYKWEGLENIVEGSYCIFTPSFFDQFGSPNQYSVFQPGGSPVFELTDEQVKDVKHLFGRMWEEIDSDYMYKYDVIRNYVLELIHYAMRMQPATNYEKNYGNASSRISSLFIELVERQFPIDDTHRQIALRTASDYAKQLNVHVNHLNRAIKEVTDKTTTQVISERLLLESKMLLKNTALNVAEIAYSLGFAEVTHFNNFFKKNVGTSPLKFRNV